MVLLVRLGIWSGDEDDEPFELAVLEAENISDLADVSDYQIAVRQLAETPGIQSVDADFKLTGHRRKLGAWRLVRDALNILLDEEAGSSPPGDCEDGRAAYGGGV